MKLSMRIVGAGMSLLCLFSTLAKADDTFVIDQTSYSLGGVSAFSEMVAREVKILALGSPMSAEDLDKILPEIVKVANRFDVEVYRENDFLVTDLFPASVTDGKHLVLIFKGDTLEKYQALKSEKEKLIEQGAWSGEKRKAVARKFGKMLSYPDHIITEMLNK